MSEAIAEFTRYRKFKVKEDTVASYQYDLKHFCVFLRNPLLGDVSLDQVMQWFELLDALGWNRNSFIVKCMALRKFFQFWQMRGEDVLNFELIPVPRKEYKMPRVCDETAYAKLLAAIPLRTRDPRHVRNRALVMMYWDTGARNSEILDLDIDDVDTNRMRAVIRTEKSRGRRPIREIFWTDGTNHALKRWMVKREALRARGVQYNNEALFVGTNGNRPGTRLTNRGVGEMLRNYCNRAGIPLINAHSMRHHMGHDIVEKSGSSADVMNILGHSTLSSSTIYTMMVDKELEARYRRFKGVGKSFTPVISPDTVIADYGIPNKSGKEQVAGFPAKPRAYLR